MSTPKPKSDKKTYKGSERRKNLVPWRPGKSGNPSGRTTEQNLIEIANAEKASKIRAGLLAVLERKLFGIDDTIDAKNLENLAQLITPQNLKLLKDSEDRGLGKPEQIITTSDKDKPDEVLIAEIKAMFNVFNIDVDINKLIGATEE